MQRRPAWFELFDALKPFSAEDWNQSSWLNRIYLIFCVCSGGREHCNAKAQMGVEKPKRDTLPRALSLRLASLRP